VNPAYPGRALEWTRRTATVRVFLTYVLALNLPRVDPPQSALISLSPLSTPFTVSDCGDEAGAAGCIATLATSELEKRTFTKSAGGVAVAETVSVLPFSTDFHGTDATVLSSKPHWVPSSL